MCRVVSPSRRYKRSIIVGWLLAARPRIASNENGPMGFGRNKIEAMTYFFDENKLRISRCFQIQLETNTFVTFLNRNSNVHRKCVFSFRWKRFVNKWNIGVAFCRPNVNFAWMTCDSCQLNVATANAHESNVRYSCMYWALCKRAANENRLKKKKREKEETHLNERDTVSQANDRRKEKSYDLLF